MASSVGNAFRGVLGRKATFQFYERSALPNKRAAQFINTRIRWNMQTFFARAAQALLVALLLSGCGGGGGGGGGSAGSNGLAASNPAPASAPVTPPPVVSPPSATPVDTSPPAMTYDWAAPSSALPASGNYLYVQSDAGDYIGNGKNYLYTDQVALMSVSSRELPRIDIMVRGDDTWRGRLTLPANANGMPTGLFKNLTGNPFPPAAVGGMDWSANSRACSSSIGWMIVDQIKVDNGNISALDVRFEQHCEQGVSALRGQLHWTKADADHPVLVNPKPVPPDLWRPAANAVPAAGNYVYLVGTPGDYISAGRSILLTPSNANIAVTNDGSDGRAVRFVAHGDSDWNGSFAGIYGWGKLQVGYYGNLDENFLLGMLSVGGEGRGCNRPTGWFAVDAISYTDGALTAIDLRFEQYCDGQTTPLNGKLHWTKANADSFIPTGPNAIPANLWRPAAGLVPATGNFVYLTSTPGDYVGKGGSALYTPSVAQINANGTGATAHISVLGDSTWFGDFAAMNSLSQLQVGYYSDVTGYPNYNPVKGGLAWSGNGSGCNHVTGWFAVDAISYSNGAMTSLDLRFEQHCEGDPNEAMRGQIHWRADEPVVALAPVNPPPANLWRPPAGALPGAGNYVYLVSDAGDYIGRGATILYTPSNAAFVVNPTRQNAFSIDVGPNHSTFVGMDSLVQLTPGYYGELQLPSNPVKGSMRWASNGSDCNTAKSWFVVDQVTYSLGVLTSIDLRFEQHCEGAVPALRGAVHWRSP
jgi:hypothetical protein